jgi:hypothetical protein
VSCAGGQQHPPWTGCRRNPPLHTCDKHMNNLWTSERTRYCAEYCAALNGDSCTANRH